MAGKNNGNNAVNSGLASIKDVIIKAHNENNLHAINMEDCDACGVSEQSLTQWKVYVENLRGAVALYFDLSSVKDSKESDIKKAKGAIFAWWKDVVKQGTEEKFSKNWFVREDDFAWLLACIRRNSSTRNGSAYSKKGLTEFRREVERLIGIRMASNSILSDEDAEIIYTYEAAERAIKVNTDRIHGVKDKVGFLGQISVMEKKIAEKTDLIKALTNNQEQIDSLLATDNLALADLRKQLKGARKAIEEAEKVISEKKEAYETLMTKVAIIEA